MRKVYDKLLLALFIFITLFVGSKSVFAQTDSTVKIKDILELSLEDLFNLEIEVASKKSEKVSTAPGMTTTYTSKDVERFGYYTLKDLANITSGYSSFSAFGETNLETRGQKAGSWNVSKHLLLVDGIPVNHTRANSAPLEYQIPIYFAENIEFLKGPGSALYGTSAFYGVMNLRSKTLKQNGVLLENKITFGDYGLSKRIMANAIAKNDQGEFKLSASYFERGFTGDSIGRPHANYHFDNDNSYFMNTSYRVDESFLKGVTVGAIYMKRNSNGGEFWGPASTPNNYITWTEFIPYIKYQRQITGKLTFNSYTKYNASKEEGGIGYLNLPVRNNSPYVGYSYTTVNVEGLAEFNYQISNRSSIITGLNFDTRQETGNRTLSYNWGITAVRDTSAAITYDYYFEDQPAGDRFNIISAYTQYQTEFSVLKGLILTTGGRFDNGYSTAGTYSKFSPRVALVQKMSNQFNAKLLYGQALRVPMSKEVGLNNDVINEIRQNGGTGNTSVIPTVRPEVISSFEAGVNYNTSKFSLALASFYNSTKDALDGVQYSYIDRSGDVQMPNYFANLDGEITALGLEFDAQYAYNKDVRIMLNHSIANSVINDTIQFTDVPTQKTNAAITYVLPGKFKLSSTLIFRKVWGFKVAEGVYDTSILPVNNQVMDGYSLLDVNFLIPVITNVAFEFQIRNLLNTSWYQPSLLGQSSMIPLQRRNFMITIGVKF